MLLLPTFARLEIVAVAAARRRLDERRGRCGHLLVLCVRMAKMMGAEMVEVGAVRRIRHASVRIQHAARVAAGTEGTAAGWRRHGRTVHVQTGILFLPFGATILEPDFHLREIETHSHHVRYTFVRG